MDTQGENKCASDSLSYTFIQGMTLTSSKGSYGIYYLTITPITCASLSSLVPKITLALADVQANPLSQAIVLPYSVTCSRPC